MQTENPSREVVWTGDNEKDRELFSEVYLTEDTYSRLRKLACRFAIPGCDPEDVLHQSLMRAFRFRHRYSPSVGGSFSTWATRIMFNEARSMRRANKRRENTRARHQARELPTSREADFAEEYVSQLALEEAVREILQVLPPETQKLLRLQAEGHQYPEIAKAEGMPEGTVKARIFRARRSLRLGVLAS